MRLGKLSLKKVLVAGILLILLYLYGAGEYNVFTLWRLSNQKKDLQSKIAAENDLRERHLTEIERLRSDSTYIEKIAREQFRMGHEGEKVYIVEDKDD